MIIHDIPFLASNDTTLEKAFRIAVGDICSGIVPFNEGQLTEPKNCIAAGLNYPTLWTRDVSINTLTCIGLFLPEVAEDSLRAVLTEDRERGDWRIGGQYWDAMLWTWGAWHYYLYRGDRSFLAEALDISERSMRYFEETEFDETRGLFRGPAFYQDGISGYPDRLSNNFGSDVRDWIKANTPYPTGFGIPWFSLSTNCIYAHAYEVIDLIREELNQPPSPSASDNRKRLVEAIQNNFWNDQRSSFDYLVYPDGSRCEHQEGAGLAFAILFGIATSEQIERILENTHLAPAGIPCVWPTLPRFADYPGNHYGRHSGTVWPQVQALWAHAALKAGRPDLFARELLLLAKHALRDGHFTEIYHPDSGEEYGGIQEHWRDSYIHEWESVPHTCWGSCSFVGLIHKGILGMTYTPEGIMFTPFLPDGIETISLSNIPYRNTMLNITLKGSGRHIHSFSVNGKAGQPFLPADASGPLNIEMFVEQRTPERLSAI